jgi:hypothetical protein
MALAGAAVAERDNVLAAQDRLGLANLYRPRRLRSWAKTKGVDPAKIISSVRAGEYARDTHQTNIIEGDWSQPLILLLDSFVLSDQANRTIAS